MFKKYPPFSPQHALLPPGEITPQECKGAKAAKFGFPGGRGVAGFQ